MKQSSLGNDTIDILKSLVSIKSDTNSKFEIDIENKILSYISSIPYFEETKNFGMEKIPEDALGRSVVWGFFKGENPNTIVFLNHHDAVDVNDFGNLMAISRDSEKIKKAFKEMDLEKEIFDDLNSEDWLFGRGSADMKAGIAIQLGLLRDLTKTSKNSILFLSVPDEENLSLGMRHCPKFMKSLKDKFGLSYKLIINSEPHSRINPKVPVIYEGSVGKTMIAVYVKGKKSHIGEIFEGFNPSLILSNIVLNTEINSEFSDCESNEISPPPSWSFVRDFKKCYDASIPESAGGYLSFLTLSRTPKQILSLMKEICIKAFENSINQYNKNSKIYYKVDSHKFSYDVNVKLYEELLEEALKNNRLGVEKALNDSYENISKMLSNGEISMPESNFEIIDTLVKFLPNNNPIVVIAISPPYYPHISNRNFKNFKSDYSLLFESKVDRKQYFMGISDLSYAAIQDYEDTAPYIKNNMPLWNEKFYSIPFKEINDLSIPVINIGPWGKDLHKYTERVYLPDIITNTPKLINELLSKLFI